jgi:sulfur carrier protein ThiS
MARVVIASALSRWLPNADAQAGGERSLDVPGESVGALLNQLFALHPNLRGYVLDEHGAVRHHVAIFVDGDAIRERSRLQQPLRADSEVVLMQALSGG